MAKWLKCMYVRIYVSLKINIFTHLSRCPMWCKSGQTKKKYEDEEIQHQKKANVLFHPHFLKCFFFIINIIITERFNIHCSRIMWYVAMQSFLFSCRPNFNNALLVYFQTVTLFHNIQNIFQTFDTKGAIKIDFNLFQFGKHSFQFSARNWNCNNLIINSM